MTNPTYPDVHVRLVGTDGNAFALIGRVAAALRQEVSGDAAAGFVSEATRCGSYDALLRHIMSTVEVS